MSYSGYIIPVSGPDRLNGRDPAWALPGVAAALEGICSRLLGLEPSEITMLRSTSKTSKPGILSVHQCDPPKPPQFNSISNHDRVVPLSLPTLQVHGLSLSSETLRPVLNRWAKPSRCDES